MVLKFPKLTTPGSALVQVWLQRRTCLGDPPALSPTGSTIAILRCSAEHSKQSTASTFVSAKRVRVGEDHECKKEAGRKAMKSPSPKDVWRYGGWLLPNTNMVPSVKDEKAALESGAVKFELDLKGVMQVERKSSDRHAEARMADFLKKFPPPETLSVKFQSYGVEEEAAKLVKEIGIIG